MTLSIEIKKILKNLLKDNDLTVAKLARATNIPPQTLNNWLAGQEPRNLVQIKTVADYFRVSVEFLVFGIQEQRKGQTSLEHQEEINAGIFEVILRKVK